MSYTVRTYQCKICKKEVKSQGIGIHMKRAHNTEAVRNFNYVLVEGAKDKDNGKKHLPKTIRCKLCNQIFSPQGIHQHMKFAHQLQVKWEVNCEKVDNPDVPTILVKKKTKRAAKKRPSVITPDLQYIEIPAIIRIPLQMGPVQIVSLDEQEIEK